MSPRTTVLAAFLATVATAACGLVAPAASAESSCGMSPARAAFDIEGLKSELMVTALSCNQQDSYNAFVQRFRPDLLREEGTLNAYFKRSYGRAAQREHDNYITQLANVQSERGLQAGTAFCSQRADMFSEVGALESMSDLSGYAEAKDIRQPAVYETCEAPLPTSPVVRQRPIHRIRHHHRRG